MKEHSQFCSFKAPDAPCNCPPNEVKKEDRLGKFVMQFLRDKDCHDPCEACEYDSDAIIREVRKSDREELIKAVENIHKRVAMSPHFPGGALEQKKQFQLEILDEVINLLKEDRAFKVEETVGGALNRLQGK